MAGLIPRLFGLLTLLIIFVASKGVKRGGEKEDERKIQILEGKNFGEEGYEGARLKGRVPYWSRMASRRGDEKDKRKNELTKKRSLSKKRWSPKKEKKNREKAKKAINGKKDKKIKKKIKKSSQASEKGAKKNPSNRRRKAKRKKERKSKNKNMRKATKKNRRKDTKKNGRKATKNNSRKATKKNGRKDKKVKNINQQKTKMKTVKTECLPTTCVDNAVNIIRLLKDRLSFYETKFRRISKKSQIGSSKSGKNLVFQPALARLIEAGGGNGSALACGGNSSNAGAGQMTNLTEVLEQCEVNVKSACDPNGFPLPNMTEVNSCLENGAIISNLNNNCTKLSGSKACSCWEGSDETEAAVEVIVFVFVFNFFIVFVFVFVFALFIVFFILRC